MDPATSATPFPTLRPVFVYPRQDKGKQRAEWPPANEVSSLLTRDAELSQEAWALINDTLGQIEPFSLENEGGSSSDYFPGRVNALFRKAESAIKSNASGKYLNICANGLAQIRAERLKQADLLGSLKKLQNICITQLTAVENLEKNHQIDIVTQLGLESGQKLQSSCLEQRFITAKQILRDVHQIVDGLIQDSDPEERLHTLDAYIKNIIGEVTVLETGLPSPAKAFLWVVWFAVILVPIVTAVWYILGSLGVFSMGAALPQAIAGCGWVLLVIAGILNKVPDFKNACAERASETPQKLIKSYETVLTVHKEMRSKMSQADIAATRRMTEGSAILSALNVDQVSKLSRDVKESRSDTAELRQMLGALSKQLTDRTPAASPDPELVAHLEKTLAEERAARLELERENAGLKMALRMNGVDISKDISKMG